MSDSIWQVPVKTIDGEEKTMEDYKGKVVLIVNTASQCGFTNQYEGLEELYHKYKERGFVVLGFPCNQFGGQEPGDESEIKNFCSTEYRITFPMHAKIEVNGDGEHPLYKILKTTAPGVMGTKAIKWNFTKFLVDRQGEGIERFSPQDKPKKLENYIEALL